MDGCRNPVRNVWGEVSSDAFPCFPGPIKCFLDHLRESCPSQKNQDVEFTTLASEIPKRRIHIRDLEGHMSLEFESSEEQEDGSEEHLLIPVSFQDSAMTGQANMF